MIIVDAKNSVEFVQKYLLGFEKQIPYATSLAINSTAKDVQEGLVNEMKSVFDRPTRWTLNSLMVEFANKQNQTAVIRFKDDSAGGRSAEKYLTPEILGGYRNVKGFEKVLKRLGMPDGTEAVPASRFILDRYGNFSKSSVNKIINLLKKGYDDDYSDRYFISNGKGKTAHLFPGIYYRYGYSEAGDYQPKTSRKSSAFIRKKGKKGARVAPVILFINKHSYKQRFSFHEVGLEIAKKVFERNFESAAQKAIATARP